MDKKSFLDSEEWQTATKFFQEAMNELEMEQEVFWKSLSEEEQLKVFCAVVRRIYKGEIADRHSYRGVLYDVFEFGMDSYAPAQCAGYLDIHNTLYDGIHLGDEVERYSEALSNIQAITTDEKILSIIKEVTAK